MNLFRFIFASVYKLPQNVLILRKEKERKILGERKGATEDRETVRVR